MTPTQRGYYISLLAEQWAAGGKLPNNLDALWVLAGARSKAQFEKESGPVLEKFPVCGSRHYRANPRLASEASKSQVIIELNRAAGKYSAKLRQERKLSGNARSTPVQRPFNGKPTELQQQLHQQQHKEKPTPRAEPARFVLPEWVPAKPWADYEEMRRGKRAKMTDAARRLQLKNLENLQAKGNDPTEVLNQSTANSWTALYEIKQGDGNAAKRFPGSGLTAKEQIEQFNRNAKNLGIKIH